MHKYLVIAGYVLCCLFFTYPLVLDINGSIPSDTRYFGNYHGDTFMFYWNMWWFKTALLDLFSSPFYCTYAYYPMGVTLIFHTTVPFFSIISVIPGLLIGLTMTYNLIFLGCLFLAAYGAYLLADLLLDNEWIAFIAGVIYGFNPYLLYRGTCHLNMAVAFTIPFFLYFLLRALSMDDMLRGANPALQSPYRRMLLAMYCGCFAFIASLTSYYYFFFIQLLLIYTLFYLGFSRSGRSILHHASYTIVIIELIGAAGIAPLVSKMLATIERYGNFVDVKLAAGADLLGLFIPSALHPFFGSLSLQMLEKDKESFSIYIGWVVIALIAIGILKMRRTEMVRYFGIMGLASLILLVGPAPRFAGQNYLEYIPFPFRVIMSAPILSAIRVSARFMAVLMLVASMLAALGMVWIMTSRGVKGKRLARLLPLLILFFIVFEYLPIPYPTARLIHHPVYDSIANEPGDFTVVDIPLLQRPSNRTQYFATVHQKRVLHTHIGYLPDYIDKYYHRAPLIEDLLALQSGYSVRQPTRSLQDIKEACRLYKIRYIIIQRQVLPVNAVNNFRQYFDKLGDLVGPALEDRQLIVYRTLVNLEPSDIEIRPGNPGVDAYFTYGWALGSIQDSNSSYFRTLERSAEVLLPTWRQERAYFTFTVKPTASKDNERLYVTVYINDEYLIRLHLAPREYTYQFNLSEKLLKHDPARVRFQFDYQAQDEKPYLKHEPIEVAFKEITLIF